MSDKAPTEMMRGVAKVGILLAVVLFPSCGRSEQKAPDAARTQGAPAVDSAIIPSQSDPTRETVRQRWFKEHSYYAFIEIVDSELDPAWRPAVTMKDVERALGPPTCAGPDCYPHFTKRDWIYETNRSFPAGDKAIFKFDEHSVLKSIDWVSE